MRDLDSLGSVRVYFLAGLQHYSGPFPPSRGTNPALIARFPQNPNPMRWYWRALFVNLDAWVAEGIAPPPSVFPHLADGTLVGNGLKYEDNGALSVTAMASTAARLSATFPYVTPIATAWPASNSPSTIGCGKAASRCNCRSISGCSTSCIN